VAQRLSNQEIAEKLFISIATVKSHLKNIYQKLDVSKRREAVEKAKNLGILKQREVPEREKPKKLLVKKLHRKNPSF